MLDLRISVRAGMSRSTARRIRTALLPACVFLAVSSAWAQNAVVLENQQPGTAAWQIGLSGYTRADDTTNQVRGYASATSVNKGESIDFFVTVNPAQTYTIDVYRIGWYNGLGGRLMQHVGPLNGIQQPKCPVDLSTGLIVCPWSASHRLNVQADWTSGIYLALLTNSKNYQSYIIFVVRDDARPAALLYQQSVSTFQAYNNYPDDGKTGKSLYDGGSYGSKTSLGTQRAVKVSFDRPYTYIDHTGAGEFLRWEIYAVRFLEKNGYDVAYSTDIDTHTNGQRLLNYKGFLSVGHDEYWSKEMYDAADNARDGGTSLAFFGANGDYWQIRFEPSASGVLNRVIVCYKDQALDPIGPPYTTVTWRSSLLNRAEQKLMGLMYTSYIDGEVPGVPYTVQNSSHWVYDGTGFKDGDSVPGIVGYEMDRLFTEYPRPPAVSNTYTILSTSHFTDYYKNSDDANSSIYQASSGAWVFAAGSIYWSWGLDNWVPPAGINTRGGRNLADARIQRTTSNVLDRFIGFANVQPLGTPTSLGASAVSDTQIDLTWRDNASAEIGYTLQRSADTSFGTATEISLPANTTSYRDAPGSGTWSYRVRASDGTNNSGWSNVATAATIPSAPSGLAAIAQSSTTVSLNWTDNASNETGYAVQRSTSGGTWTTVNAALPPSSTSWNDSSLVPLTTYNYRVAAVNGSGSSAYSNIVTVTTPNGPPAAPSGLTATRSGGGANQRVALTWIDNATNETGFVIERATGTSEPFAILASVNTANATSFTDSSPQRSTTYRYRVSAVNALGTSTPSNIVSVTTR